LEVYVPENLPMKPGAYWKFSERADEETNLIKAKTSRKYCYNIYGDLSRSWQELQAENTVIKSLLPRASIS